jgi:hypothetical protein
VRSGSSGGLGVTYHIRNKESQKRKGGTDFADCSDQWVGLGWVAGGSYEVLGTDVL